MRNTRAGLGSLLLAALLASPAAALAQTNIFDIDPGPRRLDVSGSSGFLLSTDWSDLVLLGSISSVSGVLEQVLVRDLEVEPGPVFDGVLTYWEGRYGFRAHAGFANSCLAIGGNCGRGSVDVDAWMYDIGGSVGLMDYRRDLWAWPYFFLGLGGVTYNLEQTVSPPLTFIERRPVGGSNADVIVSRDDPDPLLIAVDELGVETRFALTLGIGTDFRVPLGPASIGLRLEVSDLIHQSPVNLSVTELDNGGQPSSVNFGYVHNLRAAAGLVLQFGR